MQERNELRHDLHVANMRLNSREMERDRSTKAYERKIMELESRLQAAERTGVKPGQLPNSVQQMLDSALAASNAKLQQMKQTHYRLLDRYTELEMKYTTLESERQAEVPRFNVSEKSNYNELMGGTLSRQYSTRSNAPPYDAKYPPQVSTQSQEEYDYYNEYHSPTYATSPSSQAFARPVRHESLADSKSPGDQTSPTDFSAAYERSLNSQFQSPPTADVVVSSGKSSYSVDSNGSKGDKKEKVPPKPEVRYYGRGKHLPSVTSQSRYI